MLTKAVRLYGANDIRLEQFELPEITDNEVLMEVVTDTLCTSTYKAVKQGSKHKRVPLDVDKNPVIIGHEMCGVIRKVGSALKGKFKVGSKAVIQPALKLESGYDPGYSYKYIGGNATYVVVPQIVIERGCLINFDGESFFEGSLVEALGCLLRGFKGFYHTDYTDYVRTDGAKKGGRLAILGGAGPMGIGAIELACGYAGVKQVVVTDIDKKRIEWAKTKCSPARFSEKGVELVYVNTKDDINADKTLIDISNGGFDDVFVMAPVASLFNLAEKICREDGCVNFFAGPPVHDLQGSLNLYRIHYDGIHVVGTAGSIPQDTLDTIKIIENGLINSGALVSHILGLNEVIPAIYAMEKPNGAKKVCYTGLDIPMVALEDFKELGKTDPMYLELDKIVKANGGLWCKQAEDYLLAHAPKVKVGL